MNAFLPMLKNVLLFVLLAVPGYILVKSRGLKGEQSGVLSKLLVTVAMPFLIISGTLGIEFNKETIFGLVTAGILCAGFTFLFFYLSLVFSKKTGEEEFERKKRGVIRFSQIFSNNGFLGLPLASAIGVNATVYAYLVVINIINNVLIYTLGIYLISGDKKSINVKNVFLNPVLIGFVVGIIINLTGLAKIEEVRTFSNHFKNIVTPISMLILGMKMGEIKFTSLFSSKMLYWVSTIKLIVFPVIAVALTYLLSLILQIDTINMIIAIFIGFSMPTAGLGTAFADKLNGDVKNSAIFTLGTAILSVITIPILYYLLDIFISVL